MKDTKFVGQSVSMLRVYFLNFSVPIFLYNIQTKESLSYLNERKEFWAQQQSEQPEFPEELDNIQPKNSWNTMAKKVDNNRKLNY